MNFKTKELRFTDDSGKTYVLFLKEEFFNEYKNLDSKSIYKLNSERKLAQYLHSLEGPAVILLDGNMTAYRINGKLFQNRQEWEKEVHKIKFGNKLDNLIEND